MRVPTGPEIRNVHDAKSDNFPLLAMTLAIDLVEFRE
jgi:hypothetical protein